MPRKQSATPAPPALDPRGSAVDVVVTVCDALDYLRPCLESLQRHSDGFELRVILVNDGSGSATSQWLRDAAATRPTLRLIEHDENRGYTAAVNSGLRATTAPWVVVINSDTVVTAGWLARMLSCAAQTPHIGLVGPLSNAASWQSVPELFAADGRFAVNELPPDLDTDGMAELVSAVSQRRYPRVSVLNGFCLLLRRDVLERVGLMDEASFAIGYGEENDYCLRAGDAGFELAVADDAFVFHAKSRSFGNERRVELTRRGSEALVRKHGEARVRELSREIENNRELHAARETVRLALARRLEATQARPLRVLFLLHVPGASGGANSVMLEAAELVKLGAFVRVAVPAHALGDLGAIYAEVPHVRELLIGSTPGQLPAIARDFDVVVATAYYTMEWVARIVAARPAIVPAYYVQDYEPWFSPDDEALSRAAAASYTRVPRALLFAKTEFLVRTLRQRHGIVVHKVEPSLDHATYYPREPGGGDERDVVRVTAMVRPQTPRRGAARTMRVLRELSRSCGSRLEIQLFGCASSDARFHALERGFSFTNHGALRRPEVAELLRGSDVFIDLSEYQAFGRASLEAMACGCVPVVPLLGGCEEFALDGVNSLVVDTASESACLERIGWLLVRPEERKRMRRSGLETAARFSVSRAAQSELTMFTTTALAWRSEHPPGDPGRRVALVNLGPFPDERLALGAAIGAWKLPSVQRRWDVVELDHLPKPGSAEVAVIALRLEDTNWDEVVTWLRLWRRTRARVVVQLEMSAVGPLSTPPPLEAKSLRALNWLTQVVDAVTVCSAELQQSLAGIGIEARLVPLALDPIIWRLGPAAQRRGGRRRASGGLVVGLLGSSMQLELVQAATALKNAYGKQVALQSLGADGPAARLGKKLSRPRLRDEAQLSEWAFDTLRWDVGLVSALTADFEQERRVLELAALGIPVLRVGVDPTEDERALVALIDDAAARVRHAAAGLEALTVAHERMDQEAAALRLLDELSTTPARGASTQLSGAPRGWVGRLWPGWYERRFMQEQVAAPFPEPRSKARRKLDKLRRDPAAFVRDSRIAEKLDVLQRGVTRVLKHPKPRS